MSNLIKLVIGVILSISLVYALITDWVITLTVIGVLLAFIAGAGLALYVFALVSIFFKEQLTHSPDKKNRLSLFIEVEEKRAAVIDRSGSPITIIRGGDKPASTMPEKAKSDGAKGGSGYVTSWPKFLGNEPVKISVNWIYQCWQWYQTYVYNQTGLYVYLPFFTKPKVIPLPRYRVRSEGGKKVYEHVDKDDKGYYTNHVRLAPTPWYFKYTGVDIDGVPFTVTGSILYQIEDKNKAIYNSLYKAKDWNVLLDEAGNSVIRSAIRDRATIDSVLGKVTDKLWDEEKTVSTEDIKGELFGHLSRILLSKITGPVIGQITDTAGKGDGEVRAMTGVGGLSKLSDYGIKVYQVFITDFDSELEGEELAALRAPALGRQKARARVLAGKADASAQEALIDVHGKEGSAKIIEADALVRALQGAQGKGGGSATDALLATLVQKNRGQGGES